MYHDFIALACLPTCTRGFGSGEQMTRGPYPPDPTRKLAELTGARVLPYILLTLIHRRDIAN
jgi:hypothetical protein